MPWGAKATYTYVEDYGKTDRATTVHNAQAAADCDSHLVVAEHVSQSAHDKQEMVPAERPKADVDL